MNCDGRGTQRALASIAVGRGQLRDPVVPASTPAPAAAGRPRRPATWCRRCAATGRHGPECSTRNIGRKSRRVAHLTSLTNPLPTLNVASGRFHPSKWSRRSAPRDGFGGQRWRTTDESVDGDRRGDAGGRGRARARIAWCRCRCTPRSRPPTRRPRCWPSMRAALGGAKLDQVKAVSVEGPFRREMGQRQMEGTVVLVLQGPTRCTGARTPSSPAARRSSASPPSPARRPWEDTQNRGGMGGGMQS